MTKWRIAKVIFLGTTGVFLFAHFPAEYQWQKFITVTMWLPNKRSPLHHTCTLAILFNSSDPGGLVVIRNTCNILHSITLLLSIIIM